MPIEWSARARADLSNLRDYIAKDSPVYARRVSERIVAAVEKLREFPGIGRRVPEAGGRDDLRERIDQNYRIIYLAKPDRIVIVTVVHGRRDLTGEAWERIGD